MTDWFSSMLNQMTELSALYGMSVIGAILTLIFGFWLSRIIEKLVLRALKKTEKIDDTIGLFLSSMARYLVLIFTILAVLDQFGVETTSIIAILGAAGLAVGLALQGTLSNVASGVMLLIFRPFNIGDFVEAGGLSGTIKRIGLFSTEMDTTDNVRIITPNSKIWGTSIKNYAVNDQRRIQLDIGIDYEDNIEKAFEVVNSILEKDDRALKDPEPAFLVGGLGESSVDLIIRVWCQRGDFGSLKSDLIKAVKEKFEEEGITLPYPHRVIESKTKS